MDVIAPQQRQRRAIGLKALAAAFGGEVVRAPEPVHGRTAWITHHQQNVLAGLPNPFRAMRYHSLIAEAETLPVMLKVTARSEDGLIMGIAHAARPCFGVQFHPESVLTEHGHRLLANFVRCAGLSVTESHSGDWQPVPLTSREMPPLPYPVPWL